MTFIEFIQSSPGMTGYAVEQYRVIDAVAERAGKKIAAGYTPESLREIPGSTWARSFNETMAAALERDPSGKLASVPALRAWAMGPDGIGNTWINFYVMYLTAYLDAQKAPALVPLMVA